MGDKRHSTSQLRSGSVCHLKMYIIWRCKRLWCIIISASQHRNPIDETMHCNHTCDSRNQCIVLIIQKSQKRMWSFMKTDNAAIMRARSIKIFIRYNTASHYIHAITSTLRIIRFWQLMNIKAFGMTNFNDTKGFW